MQALLMQALYLPIKKKKHIPINHKHSLCYFTQPCQNLMTH